MNEKPHVWLIYFFTSQRPDGSVTKGFDALTTKATGIKLLNEAVAYIKGYCPGEEYPIIANMSDLGENDADTPAIQTNTGKEGR